MHMGSENMICDNETESVNMVGEFAGCLSRCMHQFGYLPVKKWLGLVGSDVQSATNFASCTLLVEDNAALKYLPAGSWNVVLN